jgi:hypothetical protein
MEKRGNGTISDELRPYPAQQYGVVALALAGKYIAYKLSQPGLKHS